MKQARGLLCSICRKNVLPVLIEIILTSIAYTANGATIATGFETSGDWNSDITAANIADETTRHILVVEESTRILNEITTPSPLSQHNGSTTFEPVTREVDGRDGSNNMQNPTKQALEGTTAGLGNSNNGETDIVTIVGAVCGVIGLLLGIILSAAIWLYISKRRVRQRNEIAKNPVEKTFEKLDFNLSLPRDQENHQQIPHSVPSSSPSSSSRSSPRNPERESSYMHFDEPIPFEMDVYESGRSHSRHPTPPRAPSDNDDAFQEENVQYEQDNEAGDNVYGGRIPENNLHRYLSKSRSHEPGVHGCPATVGNKHASSSSYSALLHQDSSDQSSISRMSSSVTGIGARRSSSCTYRTDLPDSDGSNSSTCGGSISVSSSLPRDKPSSNYNDRIHDYATSRSSYFSDSNTMSTHVPSSYTTEAPVHIHDEDFEDNIDETSLSSSDLFMTGHENSIFEDEEKKSNTAVNSEDDEALSYFDLKLPPATFGSPHRPSICYEVDESDISDDIAFRRHSASSALSDEFTIKSSNSDMTINL